MRRQEQQADRPKTGYPPVLLFNQRKRNRIPLKSAPCGNEFFSQSEYLASSSSSAPHSSSGAYGCYQASGPSSAAPQSHQWNRQGIPQAANAQQYYSNTPAPGPSPTIRTYAPMPHPYKAGAKSSVMGQSRDLVRQDSSAGGSFKQNKNQGSFGRENSENKPTPPPGFSQMVQQPPHKPAVSTLQYSQQSRPLPPPETPAQRPSALNKPWKFTNSFEQERPNIGAKRSLNQSQTARPAKTQQEALPVKPAVENSLRILTTVIEGMRHWSQFKDKVSYLFEIFATLDSAVTLGSYGAKNFLLRDGKEVVQCVFYENERVLPRLIRGQVHRCVGNYDRGRDILVCVSVRAGLSSEQRNAQEAIRASDAEMRALVKTLSEV
ncbi:spermatogenesis-associated protein 22 [Kryptolebias marmoratus]|uniref:spermatogenesis-associated protein 22 n=1 Tax=Kryptolebias marmoratus TaxID=37003 RepID=UPI0007F8FD0B|nr:spermatogenesis-associated protein 22 [Kryptolebias marmoratus]